MSTPPIPFQVGDLIANRYRFDGPLGRPGFFGYALRAWDCFTDSPVVCKLPCSDEAKDQFLPQYRKLRSIVAPDVVRVLAFERHGMADASLPFIVMEYIDGSPVDEEWLKGKNRRDVVDVLARVAAALAHVHGAGLKHGDVHGRNVLVSNARVVLIDPDAYSFGSTTERIPERPTNDCIQFAKFARLLLAHDAELIAGPMLSLLEGPEALLPQMSDVANALAAKLRSSLVGESLGMPAEMAARAREERTDRSKQYARVRSARQLAIGDLAARVRQHAEAFEVQVVAQAIDEAIKADAALPEGPRGNLLPQAITCTSPDGDSWSIVFEDRQNFRKPFPYPDRPELIARAESSINFEHSFPVLQQLEATLGPSGPAVNLVLDDHVVAFDDQWIIRNLRVLLGLSTSGLPRPLRVDGEKEVPTSWPTDLALTEGDLVFDENADLKVVKGLEWLKQDIWLSLAADDEVNLSTFFDIPIAERSRFLNRFVIDHIAPEHGRFIDTIYRFDIVETDPGTSQIIVEIEIKPHWFSEHCVWRGKVRFS